MRISDWSSDVCSSDLVMDTAYDAPGARMADEAGVDMILVGDSVAMVVLGYDDTLQVSVADLAHHTGAVARGLATSAPHRDETKPLIVPDLPCISFHTTPVDPLNHTPTPIPPPPP